MARRLPISFEAQQSRVPAYRAVQFPGDVKQATERIGACSVFDRSDGIPMGANGIDKVLHVRRTYFVLSLFYFLLLFLQKGRIRTFNITTRHFQPSLVTDELDAFSNFVKVSLGSWLEKIDDETRQSVVSTVFSMIEETEAETFEEFSDSLFKNTRIMLKSLVKLPKEKRNELMGALSTLIQVSGKTAFGKIPKISSK